MFDSNIVKAIQELAVYGVTILAAAGIVKGALQRILKSTANWIGYLSSVLVSAGFTAFYLLSSHTFSVISFVGYTVLVCLTGNLIFKEVHTSTPQP